jgi:twitching motility protein PilU
MDIAPFLKLMADKEASDLFFSVGAPPTIKINGKTTPLSDKELQPGQVKTLAYTLIIDQQRAEFEKTMELNFAINLDDVGRYRVNLYRQRGEVSMVIRYIKSKIPSIEDLHLPQILKNWYWNPAA